MRRMRRRPPTFVALLTAEREDRKNRRAETRAAGNRISLPWVHPAQGLMLIQGENGMILVTEKTSPAPFGTHSRSRQFDLAGSREQKHG